VKFVITERAETITHQPFNKWLHWLAISVAAMSVILIAAGALVTSTKSGDAIPDWPTSYGALIPSYLAGGVLFEWLHRVIAGFTALLVFALALALVFSSAPRWLKWMGILALLAIVAQAVLGGLRVLVVSHERVQEVVLTVTKANHPDTLRILFAVAHATLAQIVLALTFAIALFTKPALEKVRSAGCEVQEVGGQKGETVLFRLNRLRYTAVALIALIFVQLILGAIMRHMEAGLIIPDFPTSFGKVVPPFGNLPFDPNNPTRMTYSEFAFKVAVNFAHRLNGFVIAIVIFVLFGIVKSLPFAQLKRLGKWLVSLVVLQVALGGLSVWTGLAVPVTIAHVAVGATLLGLSVLAFCQTFTQEKAKATA
jgi:cytochrome c oxidase assembly protein subunit 15